MMTAAARTSRFGILVLGLVGALVVTSAALAPSSGAGSYSEQQGSHGVNTFTNYHNASGMGPRIDAGAWVTVSCKVYDPTIASVNPDGYWYRIQSAPWNDAYYAPANTFMNGDPWGGPYTHNTDFGVPDCGSTTPPPPPPPPPAQPSVTLARGGAATAGSWYAVSLNNFAPSANISVSCRDSADPGGFRTFTIHTDGSGKGSSSSGCYSGDGPDHWVVANGVESNHISWAGGGTSTGGGTVGGTGGTGGSTTGPGSTGPSGPPKATLHGSDPCLARYGSGNTSSHSIFGGYETNYDRTASLYQVCEGFGAPDGVGYSIAMKCGVIAALATFAGPPASYKVDEVCDRLGLAEDIAQKDVAGAFGGWGCNMFADLFATGAGVLAAGAAAESGPGAVAVGVWTYRALAGFMKFGCAGLFDGGAFDFGYNQEAKHEYHVALDVASQGKCIRMRSVFGLLQWSAASC